MKNFPNPDFPISSADCAEIEAIFIDLVRARDSEAASAVLPFAEPNGQPPDARV